MKPLSDSLFEGFDWVFQHDSTPGHKATTTQEWLENNVSNFIKASDWPSVSPDLNLFDYGLWSILKERPLDLLAAAKLNDEAINEEQPVHGNKMSKKNKKKNKKQDLEDESEANTLKADQENEKLNEEEPLNRGNKVSKKK
ncbi:uncharacterized protein LOC112686886 [Sipha flava]|uniref:Uncharacterized protein LOC112686886 n=1 Tax=Sipha flava TaxID=143950 RepID=A0A8B8FWB7_9HEMI|nr:uncharacterized protein LOC112686886 [Sipha flava]